MDLLPALNRGLMRAYPIDLPASNESEVPSIVFCPVCGSFTPLAPFGENIREGGHCLQCMSWNRRRAFAVVLLRAMVETTGMQFSSLADPLIPSDIKIYNSEISGATHQLLSRLQGYQCGEFVGPGHASGDVVDGVLHQSLMATSFSDNTFDFVLTCDVFEHIAEPYLAHQEIFRILKPGGRHIFSVPSSVNMLLDLQTAVVTSEGIDYIKPAEYHGPPLDQNLVYNIFGLEMLVELRAMGYEPIVWHVDDPDLGIIGDGTQIYEVVKRFEPSGRPVPQCRRIQPTPVLNSESRVAGTAPVKS